MGSSERIVKEDFTRSRRVMKSVIGAVVIVLGVLYTLEARNYQWGQISRPGPALFPTLIGVSLTAVGLLILISTLLGRGLEEGEAIRRHRNDTIRLRKLIALVVLYVVGLYTFGFTLSSLLAVFGLLIILESTAGLRGKLAYTIVLVLGAEGMFTSLFGLAFPGGWMGFLR